MLTIVKQESQCERWNRMRRGISRDLSFEVQKVLLSIFASSVLLYEQVLYSGHTPEEGYLHGIHIPCQGWDLVYAF